MEQTGVATFHTVSENEKRAFCHHLNVNLDVSQVLFRMTTILKM